MNQMRRSILIVDDSEEMRELLSMILGDKFEVSTAPDGMTALRDISSVRPDLILLDVVMPGIDGYMVCRRIKEQPALRDVPVIFISGLNEMPDKVRAFDAGAVDYVTKPLQSAEVLARVNTHMKLRQLQLDLEVRNEMLRKTVDDLKRLEKLKDNLTHLIIHDMRTPLSVISTGLFLLANNGEGPGQPETHEFLGMAQTAAWELSTMVNGLLDVVRLESGGMILSLEQQDIREVAEKAGEALKTPIRQSGISLSINGERAIAVMDVGLIHRVFENLIGNALKLSPPGGSIEIRAFADDGTVRVEVQDSGPCIPPEHHLLIFEKFGRAAARDDFKRHASGLGLTFCKLAVEAHGGRIGVSSDEGKGNTFWFELPRAHNVES